MKQIKMLLLVGITILFTACGGGSSSENVGIEENATVPLTLNQELKSYRQSIISLQDQMYEAIGLLSNNFTKVIDANNMTIDEANAFYDKLKLMEPEIINAILLEYQISVLSNNITQEDSANIAIQYKSVIPETGILITGGTIVVGVLALYAGYEVYAHGAESKEKLYDSADNLINSAEEGSKLQNHLKTVLGLPENATKDEMLSYFRLLEDKKETVSKTMIDDASAQFPLDAEEALLYHKENVVKVAEEGAGVAFKATVAGTAAGAGAIITSAPGASNLQSALPYTTIPNTSATVTLSLTAAETTSAGIGAALGSVAVVVKSGEKEEKQTLKPEITMTKEQALEKLREMKDGVIEGLGIDDIVDAVRTVLNEIAKNSGDQVNEDGTAIIQIPKRSQVIYIEKEHVGEDIEIQKIEEPDIVVVGENTEPVMVSNVDLTDEYIEISIPLQEGIVEEPNTNEWVHVSDLDRWWQQDLGLEVEEYVFIDYLSNNMLLGTSGYRVHYWDSDPFSDATNNPVEYFGTEQKWSVPPPNLVSGTQYPMNASIKRTDGANVFYSEAEIKIIIDDYEEDDKSCLTSGEFAKNITTKVVYVTSNPSDLSANSWEGEFKVPSPGEYNNKFQIEISYPGGCCRYVYEIKEG